MNFNPINLTYKFSKNPIIHINLIYSNINIGKL